MFFESVYEKISSVLKRKYILHIIVKLIVLVHISNNCHAENLLEVYELALENDLKYLSAQESLKGGLQARKEALGALLPHIQVYGSKGYAERETQGEYPITLDQDQNPLTAEIRALRFVDNSSDENTAAWGVSLSQSVFEPSLWYEYRKGKKISEQAELEYVLEQQDLVYRVIESYFSFLLAREQLMLSTAMEEADRNLLDQSAKLKHAGVNTSVDVFQADAAMNNSKSTRLQDFELLNEAYSKLFLIVGQSFKKVHLLDLDVDLNVLEEKNRSEWLDAVLQNNLEIRLSKKIVQISKAELGGYRAQRLPKITAEIRYERNDLSTDEIDNGDAFIYKSVGKESSAVLNFSMPLYSGGTMQARTKRALYKYNQALIEQSSTIRNVTQSALMAFDKVYSVRKKLESKQNSLESSKKVLELVKKGYGVGARDLSDILLAQKNYFSALREYAEIQYQSVIHLVEAKRMLGQLTFSDVGRLNHMLSKSSTDAFPLDSAQ